MIKNLLVVSALTISLSGCALINGIKNQPTKAASVLVILSDFQWGVSAAHDQQWLSDAQYTLIEQEVAAATDAVNAAPNGPVAVAQSIVKAALLQIELQLPADSRLRPYLDAAIVLL